ncbi:unnamed protein product [Gordionus sp. m RMFG-2023]
MANRINLISSRSIVFKVSNLDAIASSKNFALNENLIEVKYFLRRMKRSPSKNLQPVLNKDPTTGNKVMDTDKRRQLLIYNPMSGGVSYLPTNSLYTSGSQLTNPFLSGTLAGNGLGMSPFNTVNLGGPTLLNPYVMTNGMNPFATNGMSPFATNGINPFIMNGMNPFAMNNQFMMQNFANPWFNNGLYLNTAFNAFNNPINLLSSANNGLRLNNMAFYNNMPLSRGGTAFIPSVGNSMNALELAGTQIAAAGSTGGGLRNFGAMGSVGFRPAYTNAFIGSGYGTGTGVGYNYGNIG